MGIPYSKERRLVRKYNTEGKTFGELTEGYFYTTNWSWDDQYSMHKLQNKSTTAYINMSQPIPCSYQKRNPKTRKHEAILLAAQQAQSTNTRNNDPSPPPPPPVEYRGITLTQLRAVAANIQRRCRTEKWTNRYTGATLRPETVTLYDAVHYIIKPFTEDRKESFVSCLPSTAGPQPPKFFASHWWGEPVLDFIKCIEQLVRDFARNHGEDGDDRRGAGLTPDTPIWVCAYANNQWRLDDDITANPKQSGFTRAVRVAEGRTVTILDKGGVVFTRIWCAFELFLTLVDVEDEEEVTGRAMEGIWAVYTAHPHTNTIYNEERDSLGIITGGAPADFGFPNNTAQREAEFPFHLIKQALNIQVETADATEHSDKVHILNSIRGHDDSIDDPPPPRHKKYRVVNHAVTAAFVSTIPSLQAASTESDEVWCAFLLALSKGRKELRMEFRFQEDGWNGLTADRAVQLIAHLPLSTVELRISDANFGVGFIEEVTKFVGKSDKLIWLSLYDSYASGGEREGQEAGVRLADAIASSGSLRDLGLCRTRLLAMENIEQWGSALMRNTKLKTLWLDKAEREILENLKERTIARSQNLRIST